MVTSKAVRTWLAAHRECRQVVIDPDGAWNEPTSTADLIARVDPGAAVRASSRSSSTPRAGPRLAEGWLAATAAAEAEVDSFLDRLGDELFEPRVHRDLGALLPAQQHRVRRVQHADPRPRDASCRPATAPLRFLANRGANGIDGLVSSGLGAAAVAAGRTFVLTGDLGLYHDMNGLLATGRLGVEATIVVMNNGGGGIFDFLPIARHRDGYEELFGTPTGLDLAKVADLYGLPFTRVASLCGPRRGARRGPGLVEIPLDRPRNVELHRQLFERVAEAVAQTR